MRPQGDANVDEQLKAKLIAYLDKMESAATAVGDFAAVEIPATIREYLTWLAVEHATYAVMHLTPLLIWLFLRTTLNGAITWADKSDAEWETPLPIGARFLKWGGLGFAFFHFNVMGVPHAMTSAKVVFAPRVVILEKVGSFVGAVKGAK